MPFNSIWLSKNLTVASLVWAAILSAPAYAAPDSSWNWNSAMAELGLPADASADKIRETRKELIIKYHPDRNSSKDALAKVQRVNSAFDYLKARDFKNTGPSGSSSGSGYSSRGYSQYSQQPPRRESPRGTGPMPNGLQKGTNVAFKVQGNRWVFDAVQSANVDGSVNTTGYHNVTAYYVEDAKSALIGQRVMITFTTGLDTKTVKRVFSNGMIAYEGGGNQLIDETFYKRQEPNDRLAGKKVRIGYRNGPAVETVKTSFVDGSIETTSGNRIHREHYSTEAADSSLVGKKILVRFSDGKGGTTYKEDVITAEFVNGYVATENFPKAHVGRDHYSLAIPDSPLVGRKVLVQFASGSKSETVKNHYDDGRIVTTSGANAPRGAYAKEVVGAKLVGRHVMVTYSNGTRRPEKVQVEYDDGSVTTEKHPAIPPNSYSPEVVGHDLVGKRVQIRDSSGYRVETVRFVFENGSLATDKNDYVTPKSYALAVSVPKAGDVVLIRMAGGAFRIERVASVDESVGAIVDTNGARYALDTYMQIADDSDRVGKPIVKKVGNDFIPDRIRLDLQSGEVLTMSNELLNESSYMVAIDSELVGKTVKISSWLGLKSGFDTVLAAFEDGAILTADSGIVRKFAVVRDRDGDGAKVKIGDEVPDSVDLKEYSRVVSGAPKVCRDLFLK